MILNSFRTSESWMMLYGF